MNSPTSEQRIAAGATGTGLVATSTDACSGETAEEIAAVSPISSTRTCWDLGTFLAGLCVNRHVIFPTSLVVPHAMGCIRPRP